MRVTNEDFLKWLLIKNPNIEPLEQYKCSKVNILCRCKVCGHKWMVCPGNLLSGKGCPVCAIKRNTMRQTKTQGQFLVELSVNNSTVDPFELYKDTNRKILFRCKKCSYKWMAKPSHKIYERPRSIHVGREARIWIERASSISFNSRSIFREIWLIDQ